MDEAQINWAIIEEEAADLLSRYIQFDTSNPPGNEAAAVEFLADILDRHGFQPRVLESAPGRANLIARLAGQDVSNTPSCLLYAHADVVPADPAAWTSPPFSGQIREGFVWGRGALDDKGLGVIFLKALILLKQFAPPLRGDVILLIGADEEENSRQGVAWLMDHHPDLIRAGYVWDEGGVSLPYIGNGRQYLHAIAVAEKGALTVRLVSSGRPGHASLPRDDSPPDRLVQALMRLKRWKRPARLTETVREMLQSLAASQSFPRSTLFAQADNDLLWPLLRSQLTQDSFLSPLIQNTVSLTILKSGQKSNIIPGQAEAILDIRLLPGEDLAAVIADLRSVLGDSIQVEIEDLPITHQPTSTDTDFYRALVETLQMIEPASLVAPYLTPGTTDSRFFRRAGMQAYGFVPMLLDGRELSRIHGVDERVSTANLRWGIQVVFETLQRL